MYRTKNEGFRLILLLSTKLPHLAPLPPAVWPFAFLFSSTAAAPRIYSSTTDKLQSRNCFELLQVFATSAVVVSNVSNHSRCDDGSDGGDSRKMMLLSAWNTAMHESNATCAVQQRSHPMINIRSDPNASVRGGNPQSSILLLSKNPHILYLNKPRTSLWEGPIARR